MKITDHRTHIKLWTVKIDIPPELTFGEPAPDGWA